MEDWSFNDQYVRKLSEGDREVEQHFTSHFGALLRIKLRTKLRSSQHIEDIRQETFLRVFQSLRKKGLQRSERLGGFVNSVCNNVMLESFRASIRHPQMPDEPPEVIDIAADPSQKVVSEERKRMVIEVLDELPAKDRELLRLVFFEEVEKEEICEEMNVTPEYLRVLVHRAKLRFRDSFIRRDPGAR